jgi:hypothetical protein
MDFIGTSRSTPLGELRAALAGGRLVTDPSILESYRHDRTALGEPGRPLYPGRAI